VSRLLKAEGNAGGPVPVTIGIKAFNEEGHIAAAIGSALAAVKPFDGEVILADCGSTDRTVEIARRFPIRIIRLADPSRRSCGSGAQLAYQQANGRLFYLLDGDMVIHADFLRVAVPFLDANPRVAGVGGRVEEVNAENEEFQIRIATGSADSHWRSGLVDRLDCGGLYRRDAIRAVGYLADPNLHSFEEFELAARLRARGWTLARLDIAAVRHFGHRTSGYGLLWRRLRSGYAGGAGETLRAALGAPHLGIVLRGLGHVRIAFALMAWWLLLAMAAALADGLAAKGAAIAALVGLPLLFLILRRRSLRLGAYSFVAWNVGTLGFIAGAMRRRADPTTPLPATEILPLLAPAADPTPDALQHVSTTPGSPPDLIPTLPAREAIGKGIQAWT
jgi:hypothetical protein